MQQNQPPRLEQQGSQLNDGTQLDLRMGNPSHRPYEEIKALEEARSAIPANERTGEYSYPQIVISIGQSIAKYRSSKIQGELQLTEKSHQDDLTLAA